MGANYGAWKFKVRLLLVHKGIWAVVNGTETDTTKDSKVFSVNGLSAKGAQVVHIQGCATSRDAWKKFSYLYENKGAASKMTLISEPMKSKMGDEDDAQDQIENIRRVAGEPGTIGSPDYEKQYKMALLPSLALAYEKLVVRLENMVDDFSIKDIHARIVRENFWLKYRGDDNES